MLSRNHENHQLLQHVYAKTLIFNLSRNRCNRPCQKIMYFLKSEVVEKQPGLPSNWLTWVWKFIHHIFIEIWRSHIGIVKKIIVLITYSPHCFAKIEASKNKKYNNQITTDRFTERPQTENINISTDHWQIHVQKKKIEVSKGPSRSPRNLPWTSRPLPGLFLTLPTVQGTPKSLRRHHISWISFKNGTRRHPKRTSKDPFD